ncbi:outer membrane beta-barrel protein [Pedobacter sp. ISL-68]|uniref:outer membrane beta-barrel protein n=1 Tax=unclassified Pedobacter TaxID=2628915 RepID=UPI001BEA69B7|nr:MULTISPECIES: outer membrane beta-barrel family protein [unclassified Pedobacter]MBT2559742.1 outer membrane beta-barrel protein [Pedobacter sp. ISL-64]MBT2592047.1 outer membrane beta-barrel protein [Pedobacter sp. ISL-68]
MEKLLPKLCFTLLILLKAFAALAVEKGVISGKVIEEVGGLSIPSAVISVYIDGSEQPIVTSATDEDGHFSIKNLKTGNYSIRVSFVGYASLKVNGIAITEKDFDKNLGALKLTSEQNSLQEVTITVQKPPIEFGADGVTYNVGSTLLAEGSTATDVLKNVPMVQVDIDGNATIAGKRSTRVFIDGKPSDYMTSNIADLLNVLPSDAIDKIEVLTNPPSKYSGDGEGIINIVMKKGFKVGFNGNVGVSSGLQGNGNTNANASYRGKSYAINGSAAYRYNVGKGDSHNFRENFFPDTTFYYDQYGAYRNHNNGGNFRIGLDWTISPKQSLRLSTNYNLNNSNSNATTDLHYLSEERIENRLRNQHNTGKGNSNNFVFNADYDLQTDTSGGKISLGLNFNTNKNIDFRDYSTTYTQPNTSAPTLQQNNNNTGNRGLNVTLDYEKPIFNKRDRIEAGLAFNYRKNDNDLLIENFNFVTQQFVRNNKLSNQFLYNENIAAAYASYNYRKVGWGVKTGVRAELTDVAFDLSTGQNYNVKPYLSVFPNLSLNRFYRKRYNIGATYSIRVNRPRENTLNPQVNNVDTLNISYGNPNLSPAYTHQFDVNFGAFGQKWSFNPRLSYSTSQGVIERYRTVTLIPGSNTARSESTYDNVGTNNSLSLILIGNYRPTNKVSANGNFSVIQSNYKSQLNNSLNRDGLSFRGAIGLSMQLPLKTAFESNLNYANNTNAQGRSKGSITSNFSARKVFLGNRLNLRVTINDILGNRTNTFYNEGQNFRLENYSTNNTQNFTFSLNYRFTKITVNKIPPPPPPAKPQ